MQLFDQASKRLVSQFIRCISSVLTKSVQFWLFVLIAALNPLYSILHLCNPVAAWLPLGYPYTLINNILKPEHQELFCYQFECCLLLSCNCHKECHSWIWCFYLSCKLLKLLHAIPIQLILLSLLQKHKHYYNCKPCLMTEIPCLW